MPAASHGARITQSTPQRPQARPPKPAPAPVQRKPFDLKIVFEGIKPILLLPAGMKVEQIEKVRLGKLDERIIEVVRAVMLEIGDPRGIERAEQALEERGLLKSQPRERRPRRQSVYLEQELGAKVYAAAKAQGISPARFIERFLRDNLDSSASSEPSPVAHVDPKP